MLQTEPKHTPSRQINVEHCKDQIIKWYLDDKLSCDAIGLAVCDLIGRNVSDNVIGKRLQSWGIPRRTSLCDTETILTVDQRSIIDGLLLGDGTLEMHGQQRTPRLSFATIHRTYAEHVIDALPFTMTLNPRPAKINEVKHDGKVQLAHSKAYYEPRTLADKCFLPLRDLWYPNHKKIVPASIALTPLTVLHWFYGDGFTTYLSDTKTGLLKQAKVQVAFCTNGFDREYVELLMDKFRLIDQRLQFYIYLKHNQPVLRSGRIETVNTLWEYIEPLFTMECFKYKLKRPQGSRLDKYALGVLNETDY